MTETAMVLTEEERQDLAAICGVYRSQCEHVRGVADMTVVSRRLVLCDRVIDAAE